MERRKFIIGAGALATGSAAAVGTGAFSTSADRTANIEVVNDADGLVALTTDIESDTIQEEDGELTIDLSNATGDGVNVNSIYQYGDILEGEHPDAVETVPSYDRWNRHPEPGEEPLYELSFGFRAYNHDSGNRDITIGYEAEESMGDTEMFVHAVNSLGFNHGDDGQPYSEVSNFAIDSSNPSGEVTFTGVSSSNEVAVSFLIDSSDGSVGDDLSGKFTVSSTSSN